MTKNSKKEINVLVRAFIQSKGKILVCKKVGEGYYFFPGGHIEFGESARKALIREIKEELGITVTKCSFIGGSEHVFTKDARKYHEINLAFKVPMKNINTESRENHIRFYLIDKNQMARNNILPISLKKAIIKWLKDKKPFWVSQL